jgi:predicted DNA-binding protein with PD1-like motif
MSDNLIARITCGAAAGLLGFAKQHNLNAAHFTAIGAFSDVTLGFFDRQRMD